MRVVEAVLESCMRGVAFVRWDAKWEQRKEFAWSLDDYDKVCYKKFVKNSTDLLVS